MYIHGDNLTGKENHKDKYHEATSRQYLSEIRVRYNQWKNANEDLKGPFKAESDIQTINSRVKLLNEYKDFLDQQHYAENFDSRSNLHSSVLEEFMYYLFRDLVAELSSSALIGKSHTFKDIFFTPKNFSEMVEEPKVLIEKKDHDFAIGVTMNSKMNCNGSSNYVQEFWDIPAVTIECKTYLDKTMLQDVSTAAETIKSKNPNALSIVVAEWLKLTESVNLYKFKVDQIYILRKQKNTDRELRYAESYEKNPIYADVVSHLFESVKTYLTSDWEGGVKFELARGYLK